MGRPPDSPDSTELGEDWESDPGGDDEESVPVLFNEDFESDCYGEDEE